MQPRIPFLLEAHHLHPRVSTPEDHAARQREILAHNRSHYPHFPWREPWAWTGAPVAVWINHGVVKVACECGNAPIVSLQWGEARCFECGAIYAGAQLTYPDDWTALVAVLLARPRMETRNWFPHETLADLQRENTEHGV